MPSPIILLPIIQFMHQFPHGVKQQQRNDKIESAMDHVKQDAAGPFGHRRGNSAQNENIRDAAQRAKHQTKCTAQNGPHQGLLLLAQAIGRQSQNQPHIQIIDIPQIDAVHQNLQTHIHKSRINAFSAKGNGKEHYHQTHRLDIGQATHNQLRSEGQTTQHTKKRDVTNRD